MHLGFEESKNLSGAECWSGELSSLYSVLESIDDGRRVHYYVCTVLKGMPV